MLRSLFLSAVLVAFFGGPDVEGSEASFLLRGGDFPIGHSVNGFSQVVEPQGGGEILVRVAVPSLAVGAAPGGFEPEPGFDETVPAGFVLPGRLHVALSGDLDAYTRATRVLQWVGSSLTLDNSNTGNQDAISVLKRGGGRCSGLANATVALLRVAGFQARTVSGLLVTDERAVPHRWLECHLPGAGWVPTDPTLGLWIVTPRHLVFADTVTNLPKIELVSIPRTLPKYPQLEGVPIRPDQGSELICRIVNPCGRSLVAILRGEAGVELRTEIEDQGFFSGMLPGRWRLEIFRGSDVVAMQTFDLGDGAHHSIALRIDDDCS